MGSPGSSRGRCSMCSVSSARRGACRGPARFCWCTRTRCTSTSISSRGPAWPSSTPRCSRRPRPSRPAAGRRSGAGRCRLSGRRQRARPRPRHGGRVAVGAAAVPAAPPAGPGLPRPLRHVDHGGRAASPERRQLPAPVRRAGAAAAARELVVDGGREHGRRGGPGARRGRAGGPPASREDPLAWAHRGPARAAVGVARDRLRGGPGHDLQRAAPLGAPLGARGHRGALTARAAGAKPAAHGARGPGGVPPAGPGAGGGGGESRRGALGRLPPRDAAPPQARARGRREPRLRRRTGRLRDGDRPLHLRQPADLDRDHVEPAPFGAGRGGGVRGDPHGAERAGARGGSETMKRLAVLMAVCFVDLLGLMLVAPLMAFYALRLHAPEWMVGPLIASFAVSQLVSSPVWGKFSDRYGRRPAMIIGLGASAFAYLIFGFANTLWLLFASRIVQGLGGGTTGVAQAYVADTMAPAERAKALGWLSAATSAGVVIGPIMGSVAHRFGTEVPGVVAAVLVMINVYFAWKWLPESRVSHGHATSPSGRQVPPAEARSVGQALWEIVRHPATPAHRVIWIYVVGMLALNVVIGVLALYLKDTYAVTEDTIGYFFPVFGIVGVLMRFSLVGWFNDRFGEVDRKSV